MDVGTWHALWSTHEQLRRLFKGGRRPWTLMVRHQWDSIGPSPAHHLGERPHHYLEVGYPFTKTIGVRHDNLPAPSPNDV